MDSSLTIRFDAATVPVTPPELVPRFGLSFHVDLDGNQAGSTEPGLSASLTIHFALQTIFTHICERATFTGVLPIGHAPLVIDSASYIGSTCGYTNPATDPPLIVYLDDPTSQQVLKIGFPAANLWFFFQWPSPVVTYNPVIGATEQEPPIWFGIDSFADVQIPMRLEFEIPPDPLDPKPTTVTLREMTYDDAPLFSASDYSVTCSGQTNFPMPMEITGPEIATALTTAGYEEGVYDLYWRIYRGAGDMIYRARCIEHDLGTQMDRIVAIGGGPGIEMDTEILAARINAMYKPLPFVVDIGGGYRHNLGFNDADEYVAREKDFQSGDYHWVGESGQVVSWDYGDDHVTIGHTRISAPGDVVAACLVTVGDHEYAQVLCLATTIVTLYRLRLEHGQSWVSCGAQGVPTASRGGLSIGNSSAPRQWRFSQSGGRVACARYGPLTAVWEALITEGESGPVFGSFALDYSLHYIDDGIITALENTEDSSGDIIISDSHIDVQYAVCFFCYYDGEILNKRTAHYHRQQQGHGEQQKTGEQAVLLSQWTAVVNLKIKDNSVVLYDVNTVDASHEFTSDGSTVWSVNSTSTIKHMSISVIDRNNLCVIVYGPTHGVNLSDLNEYVFLVDGEYYGTYDIENVNDDAISGMALYKIPPGVSLPMRKAKYYSGQSFVEAIDLSATTSVGESIGIYAYHSGSDDEKVIYNITAFTPEQEPEESFYILYSAQQFFMNFFNVPVVSVDTQFPPWGNIKANIYNNDALLYAAMVDDSTSTSETGLYLSGYGDISTLPGTGGIPFIQSIELVSPRACVFKGGTTATLPSGDPIQPPLYTDLLDAVQIARAAAEVSSSSGDPIVSNIAGDVTYDEEKLTCAMPGVILQDWTVVFHDALGHFRLDGNTLGEGVTTGSISVTLAPTNPATSTPYFTLLSDGWGATPPAGARLTFHTAPSPLATDAAMIEASALHCQWMADHDTLSELGINSSTPLQRAQATGSTATTVGEIRYRRGYQSLITSEALCAAVVDAWLADQDANAILLDPDWSLIGGYAVPAGGGSTDYIFCIMLGSVEVPP